MRAPPTTGNWLSLPRPNPAARLRLWCLPFAGGGASIWHPWAAELAPATELVALRLPGRESRLAESPISDPAALVATLTDVIQPHTDTPYALIGHSLGGLLAFAVARELLRRGMPLRGLIVSGIRAPHLPRTEPDLHALSDSELIDQLDRRYGGIPPAARDNPELLALLLPALRADLHVYESFPLVPPVPLEIPILALGGEHDPVVTRHQILGWRAHTARTFAAHFIPGGHFFLLSQGAPTIVHVREFLAGFSAAAKPALPSEPPSTTAEVVVR